MNCHILVIGRYTFLEAAQNRLFLFAVLLFLSVFGLTAFVGELAITETRQVEVGISAALLRIAAVFLSCLFVISSMVREINDKGLEMVLSLPIRRTSYYFGKLLGFSGLVFVIAMLVSIPLGIYAGFLPLCIWFVSLFCELLLMVAVALLCLFTFGTITIAFTVVMAFYILSRTMNTILLLSQSPILDTGTFTQGFMNLMLQGIAACMPDLDRFTLTDWLVYGDVKASVLGPVLGQTLVYLLLLVSAANIDFYRRNY